MLVLSWYRHNLEGGDVPDHKDDQSESSSEEKWDSTVDEGTENDEEGNNKDYLVDTSESNEEETK